MAAMLPGVISALAACRWLAARRAAPSARRTLTSGMAETGGSLQQRGWPLTVLPRWHLFALCECWPCRATRLYRQHCYCFERLLAPVAIIPHFLAAVTAALPPLYPRLHPAVLNAWHFGGLRLSGGFIACGGLNSSATKREYLHFKDMALRERFRATGTPLSGQQGGGRTSEDACLSSLFCRACSNI